MPQPFRNEHDGYLARYHQTGEARIIGHGREVLGCHHDGSIFPLEIAISEFWLDESRMYIGLVRNITKRKESEIALRESEERFRQLAENIHDVFYIRDFKTDEVLYVSPVYEDTLKQPKERLYKDAKSFLEVVHPDDIELVLVALAQQKQERWFNEEYRIIHPNGTVRWLWERTFPVRDDNGTVYRVAGILEDITERKQAEAELQKANIKLGQAYDETLVGWALALELRDKETQGHSQRVTDLTMQLAKVVGISDDELVQVRRGALLHDIGKMAISDQILLKPGKLTEDEQALMRKHPVYAYQMLFNIAYLRPALDIPYCHHERWDGTGYPRGLKGEEIPLAARIFAVVDVWDAVTSDRPYRLAWPKEQAIEHIRAQSGRHFDPQIVELFLELVSKP